MEAKQTVMVAAAQYRVEFVGTWECYAAKVATQVAEAVEQGANILVFPEYACLELASLFSSALHSDVQSLLRELQSLLPRYIELHHQLAVEHGCYIVAASYPVRQHDGSYRNRAYFFRPDGAYDFQDKLMMTRFEREQWLIDPSAEIKVFNTEFGRVGIAICYDSEFPLIAREQVAAGANLILAPSCTDTLAGYNRVKLGCRARAMENQCYVVMAPVVGITDWFDAFDVTVGAAGVFAPVDRGFPDDGIVAEGVLNADGWIVVQLDLAEIRRVRHEGQVTNYRDWPRQDLLDLAHEPETNNWLVPALVTAVLHQHVQHNPIYASSSN